MTFIAVLHYTLILMYVRLLSITDPLTAMITDRNKLNSVTIQWLLLWLFGLILVCSGSDSNANTLIHNVETTQQQQQQQQQLLHQQHNQPAMSVVAAQAQQPMVHQQSQQQQQQVESNGPPSQQDVTGMNVADNDNNDDDDEDKIYKKKCNNHYDHVINEKNHKQNNFMTVKLLKLLTKI